MVKIAREHQGLVFSDWLFAVALMLYFLMSAISLVIVGIALAWYVEAQAPVVDWVDAEGPGYRVMAVTPQYLEVRWIEMQLRLNCPGQTQVAILGPQYATHVDSYPFVVEPQRQTFTRRYPLPADLPPGPYELRILDIAQCNPLFENRQQLRVPFEFRR